MTQIPEVVRTNLLSSRKDRSWPSRDLRQPNLLPFSVSSWCYPADLGLYEKSIRSCRYIGTHPEREFEG
jgi:hypothetical protein